MKLKVTVHYFDTKGIFVAEGIDKIKRRSDNPKKVVQDAASWIRGLAQSGGQGAMPGLSNENEGWDGHALLLFDMYPPILVTLSRD